MTIKWLGANSNNYQVGRSGKTIDKIVLHWMAGTLASTDATFKDPNRIASAHYGIGQSEVHQYVKETDTAYHAGNLTVNRTSIGIEHEGGPTIPITDAVYEKSIELVTEICKRYNITPSLETIKPHRAFKATQCPGTLDLARIVDGVRKKLNNDDMIERKYLDEVIRYDDSDKVYWHVPGPEAFDKYIKDWGLVKVIPRPVTIKEVPVTVEKIVEKEVIKEVPVDKIIEVPVETLSVGQLIGALLRKLIKG